MAAATAAPPTPSTNGSGYLRASPRETIPWSGPGALGARFSWSRFLWSLVVPPRGYRTTPTAAGAVLVALAFAIGSAAYNTSSNILFIALSLLLSSLIFSGILAYLNFRRVRWRIVPEGPLRVGEATPLAVEVRNGKSILPSYSLVFEAHLREQGLRADLALPARLEAGGLTLLPLTFEPTRRGRDRLEIARVRSQYPFGFLAKSIVGSPGIEVPVWPARVAYERGRGFAATHAQGGASAKILGSGADLVALRPYQRGDPPRHIHWKASARVRRLLLRQFAAERHPGYRLLLETSANTWSPGPGFELLCSFAGTLAEDLYREGCLAAWAIDADDFQPLHRASDLEDFLDQLATLEPRPGPPTPRPRSRRLITFEPLLPRGVQALLDGIPSASAQP